MSELLSIDDPEPEPRPTNIFDGVPYGYILQPKQSAEFERHVGQHLGKLIGCVASDYFMIDPDKPSYDWTHVHARDSHLTGVLVGYAEYEVTYIDDDYCETVPGVVVGMDGSSPDAFVAAEDIQQFM